MSLHHATAKTRLQSLKVWLLAVMLGMSANVWAEIAETPATADPDTSVANEAASLSGEAELRALTFKGVEAGVTTLNELNEAWGAPQSTVHDDGLTILIYGIEPFRTVEVNVFDERVLSLVIYLADPMLDVRLAKQLKLNGLRTVTIMDEHEEVLGLSYPERGVTFGFHSDAKKNVVAHMYLEPLTAEPFVLRVAADSEHRYEQGMRDLDFALRLEPDYADAHHARADLLLNAGRLVDAARAVDRAIQLDSENLEYRLTRARISMELGRYDETDQDVTFVLEENRVPVQTRAAALLLRGDLILNSPKPNYQKAMSYHQRAIDAATPLASDNRFGVRRAAKSVLVHAHVAVAKEVAFGNWKNKKEVVPKWLDRAAAIAEEFVTHDHGDPLLRLNVSQEALAALTGIRHEVNPEQIADATIRRAEKLEASATDPIFQHQISWTLGKALLDVLRIEHARGQANSAKKYGWQAVKLLESTAASRGESPEHALLLGEAYFRLGSVYAVLLEDHATAITWYEKATKLLEKPRPAIRPYQNGQMGEWFVSIGVSYWETRDRSRSIELTQFGVRLMEDAVKSENVPQNLLEIPYSNLAHMYQQIGDDDRAKQFNELMAQAAIKDSAETTKR